MINDVPLRRCPPWQQNKIINNNNGKCGEEEGETNLAVFVKSFASASVLHSSRRLN